MTISGTAPEFLYDGLNPIQELQAGSPSATLLIGLIKVEEYFTRTDLAGARDFLADGLGSTLIGEPASHRVPQPERPSSAITAFYHFRPLSTTPAVNRRLSTAVWVSTAASTVNRLTRRPPRIRLRHPPASRRFSGVLGNRS